MRRCSARAGNGTLGGRWRCRDSRAAVRCRRRFSGCAPTILLAAVFPDQAACAENLTGEIRIPDHPLVNETISNCLHEAMDLDGLKEVLDRMGEGTLRTVAVDTPEPSPFCHEILNANPYAFLDDAPLEERRTRAVQMRRTLGPEDAQEHGRAGSRGDRAGGRGILAGGARSRRTARRAADADPACLRSRSGTSSTISSSRRVARLW